MQDDEAELTIGGILKKNGGIELIYGEADKQEKGPTQPVSPV
jgi:hypothetical protein